MRSDSAARRYSRSFRQCPALDTMMSTRGWTAVSCSSHSMPNSAATGVKPPYRES